MTQQHPPGWYGQPDGTSRYWDGQQWSTEPAVDGGQRSAVKRPWFKKKRFIIPLVLLALFIVFPKGGNGQEAAPAASTPEPTPTVALIAEASEPAAVAEPAETTPAATTAPAEAAPAEVAPAAPVTETTSEAAAEPTVESPAAPALSVSQSQAVGKAESYLEYSAFSRSGLIGQLEFEGFETAEAEFAVDHLGVDWAEQAVLKAEDYLSYSPFSLKGLIGQLEFEGFSTEHATAAANAVQVDWNEQAAKKAKDYLDYSQFSRSGLIGQLEFEGFTAEQAAFGADAVGL